MLDRIRTTGPVVRAEHWEHQHGLDTVVLTDAVERWLRWIGRTFSLVVLAAFAISIVELGVPRAHDYAAWEQTASLVALVAAALGLLMAWRWEPIGASLAMVAGVFVGALAVYQYSLLIGLGVALLFIGPASMFLLAWHRTQTWLSIIGVGTVIGVVLLVGGGAALAFYDDGYGPTHPASTATEPAASSVSWFWSGGVTDHEASVVSRVEEASSVRLGYSISPSLEPIHFIDSLTRGPLYRFGLEDLQPATTYHYVMEVDGVLETARQGVLSTYATGPLDFTVAFASCARTGSNGAVFDSILQKSPDLFINTGDLHYGDVMGNSLDEFSALYDLTLTQPAQAALYASTPVAYTWDDHDFGPNDAAGDSPSREAALVSYKTHVPHYDFGLDGADAPIAQAFTIGRVRFILTDSRSARDPKSRPDIPGKTMLGTEQLDWLLAEFADASEAYPVVVWVNSVPWIAEAESGADHWGGYTHERGLIAAAIADLSLPGLIMLSGDAHMVAIDDGSNSNYAPQGGRGFPVMQAAALDRNGSFKGGPYSEGAFPGTGQFGLLTVRDSRDHIDVELSGWTWQGEELVSLEVPIPVVAP